MRCEYCDVEITQYPDNGICPCCGGKLPPRPAARPSQPAQPAQAPVYAPAQPQPVYVSGAVTCPKCRSMLVTPVKRGFSWGLAILGFFLIPGLGLLLGFCGSRKLRLQCTQCHHKWKQR